MIHISYNNYLLRKIVRTSSDEAVFSKKINLSKLIEMLCKKYGDDFKEFVIDRKTGNLKLPILINGTRVADMNYEINDGDNINIISLITGG